MGFSQFLTLAGTLHFIPFWVNVDASWGFSIGYYTVLWIVHTDHQENPVSMALKSSSINFSETLSFSQRPTRILGLLFLYILYYNTYRSPLFYTKRGTLSHRGSISSLVKKLIRTSILPH